MKMRDAVCNICGSDKYKSYLRLKDRNRRIVVCNRCRAFRTFPYLETDYTEEEFYCEHYLKNEELFRGFARALVKVVREHKAAGRLLDIGCSVGFILEESSKIGFEAEGMELNRKAVDIARSKGFKVKTSSLDSAGYDGDIFDVVVLNHILEHIMDPNRFIEEAKRILKPDGILLIGVPNHDSLITRVYRQAWYGWGLPQHIWHFDRVSLGGLLSRAGFRIKKLIQNNQHYPFSKSFRKNLMALIARAADRFGMGDQLIVVAEKAEN